MLRRTRRTRHCQDASDRSRSRRPLSRRDANDNSPQSEATFRHIVRLAYRIREHRWEGRFDHADAAVLHDLLLDYYPEYKHEVEKAATSPLGVLVFNIKNALTHHRNDLKYRRASGLPHARSRATVMPVKIFSSYLRGEVRWLDKAPIYVYGGGARWARHGIIVFMNKNISPPDWANLRPPNPRWSDRERRS